MGADPNWEWVAAPAGPSRQEQRGAVIHGADETAQTNAPVCSHTLSGPFFYTCVTDATIFSIWKGPG